MMTLKSIIEFLGHQNKIINILKVDIEGSEWPVFESLIGTKELQVDVLRNRITPEYHLLPDLV